ncbi:MAG TPA: CoA pyrophosphatase [Sphingomicrobium sp.]|nr:CoA pyrophosphatase [Sphingomicrobium sp.]
MTLAERLEAALRPTPTVPLLPGDLIDEAQGDPIAAAVLIAVTDRADPGVILTVRREHMRTHAGQIAFPGGRLDPGEAAAQAAVREAQEEVGLDPGSVQLVATLDNYRTITGYAVTPVLAVVPPDQPLTPHDFEVSAWFEAPLAHLLDPAQQRLETAMFRGEERQYYVIDWDGRRIWGATAAMLVNLSRRLAWP